MKKLWRRLYFLMNRRRLEAELAEEMAGHREMAGQAAFGREMALKEEVREMWAWMWLDRLGQDLSYAGRRFRNAPGFTLGAVAVLALGVGVNLAELQVFDASMLHRLNVAGADRIYRFVGHTKERETTEFSQAAVEFYRENCSLCAFVVAEGTRRNLIVESESEQRATFVTGDFFESLKILPAWGRLLEERDAKPGAAAVAVLGYEYWRDRQGADPHVVGQIMRISGKPVLVVGVAPYDFDGLAPSSTTVWLPVTLREALVPGNFPPGSFAQSDEELYAKPRAGVGLAALEAQMTQLTRQLAIREPAYFRADEVMEGSRLPGTGVPARRLKPAVFLMMSMVLLVLVSSCANLGAMLIAKGLGRQREIEIRIALGAGRQRVVRQLLTENLLLAAMGSGAGLLLGYGAAKYLLNALGAPPDLRIRMDWATIAAAGALMLFSAVVFGLPAALQIAGSKHKSGRRRQVLVGVQVAVSSLLLICSGVFARNAIRNAELELKFDYRNMVVVYPSFYAKHLPAAVARQKVDQLKGRLERMPGVAAVTVAGMPPLGQRFVMDTVAGMPPVYMNYVGANYFPAMQIRVVRGRSFREGEQDVAVVSESAARAGWRDEDPVGKVWQVENAARTIVGVVRDSGANLPVDSNSVEAYIPVEGARADSVALVVHAKGDVGQVMRAIPLVSAEAREPLSVIAMRTARAQMMETFERVMIVIGSLGLLATVLAAAGMFAMVAFAVAERTREIGIRVAIGARAGDVLKLLGAQNVWPVVFGLGAGVMLGISVGRIVGSQVMLVPDPLDPGGFAIGLVAFLVIASMATLSPAMRALRIDPSSTLRCE